MNRTDPRAVEKCVERTISTVLRTGVIAAALVVLTGGMLYLPGHAFSPTDFRVFHGEPSNLRHVSGILKDAAALHSRGIIQLGLLLLIATPVVRVAFTVFAFAYARDWIYIFITLVVLALLIYSLEPWHL
jgi:uncharacterized membrane protein